MDNLDLTRIFARNCIVRRISRPEAAAFLNRHHRMGWAEARYCYGLFVKRRTGASEGSVPEGELVAAACFSGSRKMLRNGIQVRSYEWVRYASAEGLRVLGGMGRLLQAFVDEYKPGDVMTYADAFWSEGDAYKALGFELECTVSRPGFTCLKFRKNFTSANFSITCGS